MLVASILQPNLEKAKVHTPIPTLSSSTRANGLKELSREKAPWSCVTAVTMKVTS
jgi:hypothetical protein